MAAPRWLVRSGRASCSGLVRAQTPPGAARFFVLIAGHADEPVGGRLLVAGDGLEFGRGLVTCLAQPFGTAVALGVGGRGRDPLPAVLSPRRDKG